MLRRLCLSLLVPVLSAPVLLAGAPALLSDAPAKFNIAAQTEVPGLTLQPGAYSIRIMDHLADRLIVRIDGKGSVHSTFIAVPNVGIGTPEPSGLVKWRIAPEGIAAARGFSFPGGIEIEFVYPKAEAVALAKLNANKVPAIDPASEGKPADNTLSKGDMEIVTLWTLAQNKVGPGDTAPAIKAERFQQVASVTHRPVISRLPHTASYLPLIVLLGFVSLLGAALLRFNVASPSMMKP